jgi:hypothetical protein
MPPTARPGDDSEPALSYGLTHGALRGDHIWIGRSSERADRESTAVLTQDREPWSVRDRRPNINDKTAWPKDPPCAPEGIDHALSRYSAEGPGEHDDVEWTATDARLRGPREKSDGAQA